MNTPIDSCSVEINNELFTVEVWYEKDLHWKQHNQIHYGLNLAYDYRTQNFLNKSFGHCIPKIRILFYQQGQLVAHTAIFEDYLLFDEKKIKVAGIGLTFSLKPNLGFFLRKKAAEICRENNYIFAIGRVKNSESAKKKLSELVHLFLEIPLKGKNTVSHDWEMIAIYNTGGSREEVNAILDSVKESPCLQISGEIF